MVEGNDIYFHPEFMTEPRISELSLRLNNIDINEIRDDKDIVEIHEDIVIVRNPEDQNNCILKQ